MKLKLSSFIFILFSCNLSFAEITLPLPGIPYNNPNPIGELETEGESPHVQGATQPIPNMDTEEIDPHILDQNLDAKLNEPVTVNQQLKSYGVTLPDTLKSGTSYTRLSNRELLDRFQGEGSRGFSFYYIRDEYDVTDTSGVYDRTFGENVPRAMRGGTIHLSFERYWIHSSVFVGWGMNFGVGLAQGRGSFTDAGGAVQEQSSTKFSLWSLPVDLGLVLEVPLGAWLKVGLSGGPSAMGLYQHRDDRENNADDKRVRQVSWGYYGRANLKISMSHFMPRTAIGNLKAYQMTKMYLTLEARIQDYANFQDEVSITGSSFGLGFAFEYL